MVSPGFEPKLKAFNVFFFRFELFHRILIRFSYGLFLTKPQRFNPLTTLDILVHDSVITKPSSEKNRRWHEIIFKSSVKQVNRPQPRPLIPDPYLYSLTLNRKNI